MSYEARLFFWKCAKCYVVLENEKNNSENAFGFGDNGVWRCYNDLSLLWHEFLWATVKVLSNSPKTSDVTERDVF